MLKRAILRAITSHLMRAVLLAAVCAGIGSSRAQSPVAGQAVNRAELLRTEPALREPNQGTPTSDGNYVPESPNDPDLGEQAILKRQDSYKAFTFASGIPIFYTSNVALSNSNEQDDVVFAPAIGFSYNPRIKPTLFLNFSVGLQEFYYHEF